MHRSLVIGLHFSSEVHNLELFSLCSQKYYALGCLVFLLPVARFAMQVLAQRNSSYDISLGVENIPVIVTSREGTDEFPKPFTYIRNNKFHSSVSTLNPTVVKGVFCSKCVSDCGVGECCCSAFSGGGLAPYTNEGLLHPHYIEMVQSKNLFITMSIFFDALICFYRNVCLCY